MDQTIPQIKTIMAHVQQQQEFLLANLNTSHSLQDDFRQMYQSLDNDVGILANSAIESYYHDEKYTNTQGLIEIIDYVFYSFKCIYDSTDNHYIKEYIEEYLILGLYDNLHNFDANRYCHDLIQSQTPLFGK